MRNVAAPIVFLAAALLPLSGAEAAPRWAAEAALAAGYDSNPLRVRGDGPGAPYAETRIGLGAQGGGSRLAWMSELRGARRTHDGATRHADTTFVGLESAAAFGVLPSSPTRWVLRTGIRGASHRLTYVDRTTGAPAVTLTDALDPDSVVSLADRLDHDVAAAFVESRWRITRRVRAAVNVSRERTDFRDDYASHPSIPRLDQWAWVVEPRAIWEPIVGFRVDASYAMESRTYDALPAVDGSGATVATTQRRFRQGAGRISVAARVAESWDVDAGVDRSARRDRFAAYYDARGWNAWISGSRALGAGFRGRLTWSRGSLDYPNARVSTEPDAGYKESATTRITARIDRPFRGGLALTLDGGRQRADNADPELAYGRSFVQAGIRWHHEGGSR